jgi:hypothetical protein
VYFCLIKDSSADKSILRRMRGGLLDAIQSVWSTVVLDEAQLKILQLVGNKWKEFGRRHIRTWGNAEIFLEGLRKITTGLRVAGLRVEIWTQVLSSTNL